MTLRVLVADDEPELASHLKRELEGIDRFAVEVVAVARNGVEALTLCEHHGPDVVFLDIRMPGMSGLEVARQLYRRCRIVFVTAYDEYAVEAFEREAVDYILKPVTTERLIKTLSRLTDNQASPPQDMAKLAALLRQLHREESGGSAHLQWIRAGIGERVRLIAAKDVIYFKAGDKYTSVFIADGEYLIRTPLRTLLDQLDPQKFWQVHRGAIVNVGHISQIYREFGGRLTLCFADRGETLTVSRRYAHLFRQM